MMDNLEPGREIAGYRIERVAGRGGMGVVYKATQLALERPVALKVIAPEFAQDTNFRERFKRESRVAASIRHPNVIAVHDAREEDGLLFITMDYIDGTDFAAIISRDKPVDPVRAVAIVEQVALALDAAHGRGLVHRDVKPANVLVAADGGREHVYLTDFGLTKQIASESGVTTTGAFVGTVDYVAPEQINGERLDARSDVYALGCVLYHAVTGQVPYPRDTAMAKLYAHAQLAPPAARELVPSLPVEFDGVIARAMAKDREARYRSAGDLARAAAAAVRGEVVTEGERTVATGDAAPAQLAVTSPGLRAQPPPPAAPARGVRRGVVAAIVAGILAAGAVAVALILVGANDGAPAGTNSATDTARSGNATQASAQTDASDTIRPGEGIGPIALRSSKEDVDAALGSHGKPPDIGSGLVYKSSLGDFTVSYVDDQYKFIDSPNKVDPASAFVSDVSTDSSRYKLLAGGKEITTDTSFEEVRAALPRSSSSGPSWMSIRCSQTSQIVTRSAFGNSGRLAETSFQFPSNGATFVAIGILPKDADFNDPLQCFEGGE